MKSPCDPIRFSADATYIVAGGIGGLGREICLWMVSRGAKSFMLLSRSGPHTNAARELNEELQKLGVIVYMPMCNISDSNAVQRAIDLPLKERRPIRGVIQAAMVLDVSTLFP
jgi:NAD(P)-dependent dehydrogenase (short-subunit alcohol dehydrogenase family)